MSKDVRAIVLAAGKGVRMKSERAKVLHEILGRPVLHYVLKALRAAGVSDITVVVGHQEEAVRKAAGEGVRFARQTEQKGTGHAVRSAEEAFAGFDGDVFVLAGDAPLISFSSLVSMVETHRQVGAACTVLTACLDDARGYGRIVRDAAGDFARIAEETDATEGEKRIQEINSGHYVFRARDLFDALRDVKPENKKGEYYLTDVLELLRAKGARIGTYRAPEPSEAYGVNTRRDLVAATNFLRWRVLERHLENGVAVLDPSTTYIEEDVEIGPDTVIRPFSTIEHGVRIGRGCVIGPSSVVEHDVRVGDGCHVGPFARLRGGAVLEDGAEIGNFVEVNRSTVGQGSKAKHLAYLGDARLGSGVNIGAGTITANYDGKRKHATSIEDGASTGSNTVLVAPVRLGRGSKTGAGAVVLAGQDVAEGDVVAGVPARSVRGRKPKDRPA